MYIPSRVNESKIFQYKNSLKPTLMTAKPFDIHLYKLQPGSCKFVSMSVIAVGSVCIIAISGSVFFIIIISGTLSRDRIESFLVSLTSACHDRVSISNISLLLDGMNIRRTVMCANVRYWLVCHFWNGVRCNDGLLMRKGKKSVRHCVTERLNEIFCKHRDKKK